MQVGGGSLLHSVYIEAVAAEKGFRGRGCAAAIMRRLEEEIQEDELGGLSPFSVAYYQRLGWELWRGPLSIPTDVGLIETPNEGELMVLRLPKTPAFDLHAPMSAEWRKGELW